MRLPRRAKDWLAGKVILSLSVRFNSHFSDCDGAVDA
jgi:hypothetical protein